MAGFYLTLPSNASHNLFPKNSQNSYRINLAKTIDLQGSWSVALSEIHYVADVENISDNNGFEIRLRHTVNDITVHGNITAGKYKNILAVVNAVNNSIIYACKESVDFSNYITEIDRALYFEYNRVTGYATIINNTPSISILLKGDLALCLGFKPDKLFDCNRQATYRADMDIGFHTLYVYSDIVSPQVVGDSVVPLLRVVDFGKKLNGNTVHIYKNPYYIPIVRQRFENIQIDIRRDNGELVKFRRGKTVVVLHFMRNEV
jgi:hypothetical protein